MDGQNSLHLILYDDNSIGIEGIINDGGKREILVARGKEKVKEFSWERCGKETIAIFKKVAGLGFCPLSYFC